MRTFLALLCCASCLTWKAMASSLERLLEFSGDAKTTIQHAVIDDAGNIFVGGETSKPAELPGHRIQLNALGGSAGTGAQTIRLRATAGTTYVIEISNPQSAGGDYQLEIVRRRAPPDDDFARRIQLTGTNITVAGKNEFATAEPGEPAHGYFYPPEHSVWWK